MLHACVEIFDVMGGRGNILGLVGEVNKAHAHRRTQGPATLGACPGSFVSNSVDSSTDQVTGKQRKSSTFVTWIGL
jgi:hypothetical protein